MLLLNRATLEELMDVKKILELIEEAYGIVLKGGFTMPNRLSFDTEEGTIMNMPCIMGDYYSTKLITLFPGNPALGRPYVDGTMVLHEKKTGKVLAIFDSGAVTSLRTGAAGGVGVKYLSRESVRNLGIAGAGRQGFYQAVFSSSVRKLDNIYFYDIRKIDQSYVDALKKALLPNTPAIHFVDSDRELVEKSDVVITTTTSREPVLPSDPELLKGKCYVAFGTFRPDVRELPDALFPLLDKVYIEQEHACAESGDLIQPMQSGLLKKENIQFIGDLINNKDHLILPKEGETTCFKSVGIGIMDLMVARYLYERALERNAGVSFEF